jgi:chromosome segregation ATPase
MENLIPLILGVGCGLVTLLGWLWLSAESDLNRSRREVDRREAEQRKLLEELRDLKQALLNRESRLHEAVEHGHGVANQQHQLRSEFAELHRKFDDSQVRLWELAEAKQALAAAQRRIGVDSQELIRFNDRIAELAQELTKDEARLRELERICEGLAEGEPLRQALREENARHQAQLEHWRQGGVESEAGERRLALIQEQFGELLTMQAAFAEAQRRFHDALVAFAGLMDTPSKPVVQTPTFEVFRGRGAQAQPISTVNASDSRNPPQATIQSDAQRQSGVIAKLRNLKAPKAS